VCSSDLGKPAGLSDTRSFGRFASRVGIVIYPKRKGQIAGMFPGDNA